MDTVVAFLSLWCVTAVIGYFIGASRGRGAAGGWLGFFLGPIGWIIVVMMGDNRKQCPHCKGRLETLSVARCRHCGGELGITARAPGAMRGDPVEEWAKKEALMPGNLKPLGLPKRPVQIEDEEG